MGNRVQTYFIKMSGPLKVVWMAVYFAVDNLHAEYVHLQEKFYDIFDERVQSVIELSTAT